MSRSKKQAAATRKNRNKDLAPRALDARAADQVKGGAGPAAQTSSKPVARYHLENAWPSK